MSSLINDINRLLPQTQCTRCGFDGCQPYAQAIAKGTPHNQCPPGGQPTIEALSSLLKREPLPLNPDHGQEASKLTTFIDEDLCIGCTKCIQACPVDAIAGASKRMHTIITDECTGCELCIKPCPMDCIQLTEHPDQTLKSEHYQQRFEARNARLAYRAAAQRSKHEHNKNVLNPSKQTAVADKLAYIQAAIQRKQAKRS